MKCKIILLVVFLLLLCGCSAEVHLSFDENGIKEAVSITRFADQNMSKTMVYNQYREFIPAYHMVEVPDPQPDIKIEGISYYNRTVTDLGNGYRFLYSYTYPLLSYNRARSVKNSFKSPYISKDEEGIITISTDKGGNMLLTQYEDLERVKVTIDTNGYEVLESNGVFSNGVYSWDFSQTDNTNSIYLRIKKKVEDSSFNKPENLDQMQEEKKEEENFLQSHPFVVIAIGIGGFFILLILLLKMCHTEAG